MGKAAFREEVEVGRSRGEEQCQDMALQSDHVARLCMAKACGRDGMRQTASPVDPTLDEVGGQPPALLQLPRVRAMDGLGPRPRPMGAAVFDF